MPFVTAQASDPFYKCIAAGRADLFWKSQSHIKGGDDFFSEDVKSLI